MNHTVLITSGAFVEPELEAEFGPIPPAFLPLGNRRLYQYQLDLVLNKASRVLLSLPSTFAPEAFDLTVLKEAGVEIIFVPKDLSLGASIVHVLDAVGIGAAPLTILHGDTLLYGINLFIHDSVSIDRNPPRGYRWGRIKLNRNDLQILLDDVSDETDGVLSGFFSFGNTPDLINSIVQNRNDFVVALAEYATKNPLNYQEASHWFDFGHASTYHRSRRRVTTERHFNRLTSIKRGLVKSSSDSKKIEAEAAWFESLPPPLRLYTPAYLGRRNESGTVAYATEYLHLPTLSDIFVFGKLSRNSWVNIFLACDEFLSACAAHRTFDQAHVPDVGALYLEKTIYRLESFITKFDLTLTSPCRLNGRPLPSLIQMVESSCAIIKTSGNHISLVHGDFCFSNIFYDVRTELIRTIDPRGLDARDTICNIGDVRYDIGKLFHSVYGLFDHIVAGHFALGAASPLDLSLELPISPYIVSLQNIFKEQRFAGQTPAEAAGAAIATLLFFSMLPLHDDHPNRQLALLANGMRLFESLDLKK